MATKVTTGPAAKEPDPSKSPQDERTQADSPNADAVRPEGGDDELVRIDPAQNMRPAVAARGGRLPGQVPEMSKDQLADLNAEIQDLRGRLAKLEKILGPATARRTFLMSEGVRQDVELHGHATDPATGEAFTRDDLDRISEW